MYPIIINNEEELRVFINNNKMLVMSILNEDCEEGEDDELIQEYESRLMMIENELLEKQSKIDEMSKLRRGISNGVSPYHIGEFNEKVLEEALKKEFGDWEVDEIKKMHAMDIRMSKGGVRLGIECKMKKSVSKGDITKFISDKVRNKFDGNIFVSNCKISNLVENINNCCIEDGNLYIYSEDTIQIINFIKVYIESIKVEEDENEEIINNEIMKDVFNNHTKHKKELLTQDKLMVKLMRDLGLSTKGFLYMGVVSKYKGGKCPY
jgi:uncharacterized protein YbcV (DUF1398 family)